MSTRSAGDPSILLPEIEVSDLVDAIPIDIVGELLTEEDNIDDNENETIINNTTKEASNIKGAEEGRPGVDPRMATL
jgi:hypothetical protein